MKKLVSMSPILFLLIILLSWSAIGILPIFDQSIVASKFIFVLIASLLFLITYLITSLKKGFFDITKTPFTLSTGIFGLITLASIFFNNRYPVESLFNLGGLLLSFSLLIFIGSNLLKSQGSNNKRLMITLATLSSVLAITTVLQNFGYGPSLLINKILNLNLPSNLLFNLSGSVLAALQFTLVTAVGFATTVLITKKAKIWENITLVVTAISSVFYGWFLLPGKLTSPIILSPTASWSIAMSSIKSLKNILIGVGPNNYIKAFNLYKPQELNSTPFWSIQFSQGANLPLTLIVTLGIFGLIAWLIFALTIIRQSKKIKKETRPIHSMLVATLLLQLLLPVNVVMITLQAILIIFWVASERDRFPIYNFDPTSSINRINFFKNKTKYISKAIVGLLLISTLALLYFTLQASYSSFLMYKATKAANNRDFIASYSLQQKAIRLNPLLDSNRRKYSITNIIIASAISQKEELTNEDKERFSTLIGQSIRESKSAIFLDENDVTNWQILANIYKSLIGVAENSGDWAVKSYVDAIRLSPNNPELRVTLGNVFYNAKEYEEALKFFEQAALLKADHANAYYNAANTFKALNQFDEAKVAYQKTLILLQPDSDDYLKAANEMQILEELAKGEIEKQAIDKSEESNIPLSEINPIEDVVTEVEAPPEVKQNTLENNTLIEGSKIDNTTESTINDQPTQ